MAEYRRRSDICIVGAGIIGLSLALELDRRGASVTVFDRDAALSHASTAAAGMLAADDPENPAQLQPLSDLSVALYPTFLARLEALCGVIVPFQTTRTLQSYASYSAPGNRVDQTPSSSIDFRALSGRSFKLLEEYSVDPRQLAAALLAAMRQTPIQLVEHTQVGVASETKQGIQLDTSEGTFFCHRLVHTRGAWSQDMIVPRKGQMLSVALPLSLAVRDVIRTPEIYIVPRTLGVRAGTAVIGATIEDAGFDVTTHTADLSRLRRLAAELVPALADETLCPTIDQWAGLRPATPDLLPLLGPLPTSSNQFIATGHYRNGILLAPATAHVMAQLLIGEATRIDLSPYSPTRFPSRERTGR